MAPAPCGPLPSGLRALVRHVRNAAGAREDDWRAVVDGLRPVTQAMWQGLSTADKAQFLRHVRPFWDVHRHRMAPGIARCIEAARRSNQLTIHAGRVLAFAAGETAVTARIGLRAGGETTLSVARGVNCSGAAADITQVADPLIRSLLTGGLASADPMRLGLEITDHCGVRGPVSDRLFAIGPLTKGVLWEMVAVPDIRRQCAAVAGVVAQTVNQPDLVEVLG